MVILFWSIVSIIGIVWLGGWLFGKWESDKENVKDWVSGIGSIIILLVLIITLFLWWIL